MIHAALIVNPAAGADRGGALLPHLVAELQKRFGRLAVTLTTGAGDAYEAGQLAVAAGCSAVITAGGDGTLNEVINGIASTGVPLDRILLGIVPIGTGNDFARALGFSLDVDEALGVLARGAERRVDLGVLNDRWFVNTSSGGFIAEVSEATPPALKTVAGRMAFLLGGAQALWTFDPVRARVRFPSGAHRFIGSTTRSSSMADLPDLSLYAFAICNAPTIGGGRYIAPYADIADGLLDVCLIEAMSAVEFVGVLRRVVNGEHLADERVAYYRTATLEIEFERIIKVNTDGEVNEAALCRWSVMPGTARFIAPEPSNRHSET